ncbi:hypothetical protein KXV74_005546 [Aspergillus fumigatus]|nr:hypothetical protein KXX09_002110 [Aspergillus fumigatus]KAH2083594.1 hypothetical protein KXX03_002955 [Aspergillus fumigatus]KAH2165335.1 hypothetical protein KXV74_005546 [Aspergillus fumigatus]KAH2283420.1 hypothetical protein KXV50_001036 [Aspergillus fumigatus]
MAYGYSSRRSGYHRSKRGYSGRYGRRRWAMRKEMRLQAMGNPRQVIGVGKFMPNFVLNGSVHEWYMPVAVSGLVPGVEGERFFVESVQLRFMMRFVMGVDVMAFAYLGGPDRKLLMSGPAVHPKTREVLAGSGYVDVPVDGNFFENGISVPGDGGHKMEEDEVELVGQKSKRRKAATEVQGRFLMLEETGMVTSSGPMNVLKVGEKVLMDSKDGGLFDCNQSSGENGPVGVARWRVQRQSRVEKKHKVYRQSFSVSSSGAESVKTVEEAGGEVFFELKKEITKGGGDSGVERPLLIMMGFKTGVASQDPVLAGRLECIMVKVNYRGPF